MWNGMVTWKVVNSASYSSHYQKGYNVQKYWMIRHGTLLGRCSNSGAPKPAFFMPKKNLKMFCVKGWLVVRWQMGSGCSGWYFTQTGFSQGARDSCRSHLRKSSQNGCLNSWSHRSDPRPVPLFASLVSWLQCIWGRSAPSAVLHTTPSLRSPGQGTCFNCIYCDQLQFPASCSSLARFAFKQRLG